MSEPSPYIELDRTQWRELRQSTPLSLTEEDLNHLRGLGEQIDLAEVAEVYLPVSRLIHLQVAARQRLYAATATFLGERRDEGQVPFVIGVAGSVAVGKSTTARVLQALLARWDSHPRVDLVTTDGFLYPTAELERRGIMHRKGFPESYDRRALLRFVTAVKSGAEDVTAPVYSHQLYDIVPNEFIHVRRPDILIVEGLNVLQTGPRLMVSDLFDFSVYVDARIEDIERWYVDRFLSMRTTSFADPASHFHHYAGLSDIEARDRAEGIWAGINRPNLVQNILPTRPRATLVLRKDSDHSINRVRLRKL
ncbi:Pantothenate kinase OS=Tsukamurella paurometabola (strain ATCC 8368 / DSM / CCUG 35730 / CIP 100753 / JCM 10117 / KCTC 9821 / NBRC 16120 / NCIMB 702349/ NCTC 13040) OX=521096 GN=coaA PE=3 SV=1 [Tsukamurella paurometabola]|uniref:Pantothenate kinase n=1 Tax=Tsukamurella paurometabola (strain ATCC 8368 / DSM 20162 / CCUG 35730 / CIP 100753 / JCM 10117 / KCTC 9821 / NBRC 16120 / NCIMB 702349 / NCTC 13040) TaxID=521096 RepID=D5UV01_TSUPD|nr:pantothenate kinase [Tsukamurella paurometabola DSM 20162]SUP36922.1 Pantothenate kinase [Tsukamurella paurometabola]